MTMKILDARVEADTLIVRAYSEYRKEQIIEVRVPVGSPVAEPGAVTSGAYRIQDHALTIGEIYIYGSTEALYDLVGCPPLPKAPICPVHYYNGHMQEIGDGAWRCSKCAEAPVPAEVAHA